ncbi:MAG TPA: S41 family peptidase, partial [Clostridiales bacterium]|nr:S41 family peptidase [Clostridiales bacterium]
MSKKISLGLALAITFVSIAAAIAITMTTSMKIYNNLIKDLPGRSQMYAKLAEIDDLVRSEFYGKIDEEVLEDLLAQGYIAGTGDPFSRYMTADEYISYYNEIAGKMTGIGIRPSLDRDTGYILVQEVYGDSPAAAAGISKGDMITAIDGVKVEASNYREMVSKLEGDKLTSVSVTFIQSETGQKLTANISKGFTSRSVSYEKLGSIGYIRITDFYKNTASQFKDAVERLKSESVTGLIIDVRNNSKGEIRYAAEVIDVLVPLATEGTGAIATAINAAGEVIEVYSADSENVNLPMVVLVNKYSEGGAELLACDLRDYGKAQIVGETTGGKGTLQQVFRLDDGSA